jgi:NAD kinase/nicotinic acid mononucleotide adenylyltransferase
MVKRLCLFAGSFNPPGVHHVQIAQALARHFDEVRVIPSGYRPDKASHNATASPLRAALIDLAFQSIAGTTVDHFDLENASFTVCAGLDQKFAGPDCEVWHAVSAELVRGGARGESIIQRTWAQGPQIWNSLRFAVYCAPGAAPQPADCPPRSQIVDTPLHGSSLDIRHRLYENEDCSTLLPAPVREYIDRYNLFKLSPVQQEGKIDTTNARLLVFADERNAAAMQLKARFANAIDERDPDLVVVIGGDGTMLEAIQRYWRLRRPLVGLNAGHLGFLMNERDSVLSPGDGLCRELIVRRMPMLHIEFLRSGLPPVQVLSFNDAWIERSSAQTAWLRVSVNSQVKLEKVVCDGALVSTAAGSTAYAMSMGASPLLADTPAWLLVGSNVMRPAGWKAAILPLDATAVIEGQNTEKRPLNGFAFGKMVSNVSGMTARVSRVATLELAFTPAHDMATKISDLQFGRAKDF